MNKDLVAYYAARASEYEKIYDRPERQPDLTRIATILQDMFRNKDVLEIACGTGWWTERIACTARSILASDVNEAVLEIARTKQYACKQVLFQRDDIFQSAIERQFDAVFAGFIWSHIRLEDLDRFIARARRWVKPGGVLVFADNLFVEGSNTPISGSDEAGNTYQIRRLENGSEHVVLKNFPAEQFLKAKMELGGMEAVWLTMEYYWLAAGKTSD